MCSFGLFASTMKDKNLKVTREIMSFLDKKKVDYFIDYRIADMLDPSKAVRDYRNIDVLLVLGGDGTMLSAARTAAKYGTKILGLNMGRMGFLIDTELDDFSTALDRVIHGEYVLENRFMLEATIHTKDGVSTDKTSCALNEAAVFQKQSLKLINIEISVNGNFVYNLFCDGVVVSTPTGSTGYSLSAGGPILTPTLDCMLITPVCAHTLKSRSIVISGDDTVRITHKSQENNCSLSLDGQVSFDVFPGNYVEVKKTPYKASFIKFVENNFFSLLNHKLTEWQ